MADIQVGPTSTLDYSHPKGPGTVEAKARLPWFLSICHYEATTSTVSHLATLHLEIAMCTGFTSIRGKKDLCCIGKRTGSGWVMLW